MPVLAHIAPSAVYMGVTKTHTEATIALIDDVIAHTEDAIAYVEFSIAHIVRALPSWHLRYPQ